MFYNKSLCLFLYRACQILLVISYILIRAPQNTPLLRSKLTKSFVVFKSMLFFTQHIHTSYNIERLFQKSIHYRTVLCSVSFVFRWFRFWTQYCKFLHRLSLPQNTLADGSSDQRKKETQDKHTKKMQGTYVWSIKYSIRLCSTSSNVNLWISFPLFLPVENVNHIKFVVYVCMHVILPSATRADVASWLM